MSSVVSTGEKMEWSPREKPRVLHMIGNAHIDPVWLWQWQEGFQEVLATFRSALDRMQEYEDFIFVSSSAAYYEWVEQSNPQMFAEIQRRVAEGRWGLVGGWWIEPDCNIPSGESFVRQGLYGQRYFKEKFGKIARVGFNVDSFGHHGMLPQILKQSRLEYYVFMRPSSHEKGLPNRLFWWESDDGSRVLAYRLPYEYCSWGKDLEKHIRRCAAEIKAPYQEQMCFYGVGNHGGGPTRENLESILGLDGAADLPELAFSKPETFFDEALDQITDLPIPVVHSDLQHHASGCYAAHSGVKRWNRQAENRLLAAEKLSVVASLVTGQPYPAGFDRAWKNVLFNQFHDVLSGTSTEAAYEDARNAYGEALSIADRAANLAAQSLAWNIAIPVEEAARPVVVFNPHAWTAKTSVELEIGNLHEADVLMDDRDRQVPYQKIQSQAAALGRNRICFLAELPPLGYRTYRLAEKMSRSNGKAGHGFPASDTVLENDRLRLEIDPETGWLSSLRDKKAQVEVLAGPAARPVVMDDPSDTWGHNVFKFDRETGVFRARSVRLVEQGPVRAAIRVESDYGNSRLTQDFTLYHGLDQISVRVRLDWREQQKMMKLRFPVNVTFMKATYEIPYGTIERFANGEEEPGQSWIDLTGISRDSGEPYGLSLLNDGKYSFDVNVRDIGLTAVRSPIYAHHMPVVPDPGAVYTCMDQGLQEFRYVLLPHRDSWETAGTVRRAAELNQNPITLPGTFHPNGRLPLTASYLSVDAENIQVTALKQAEDNDDLILRAYETNRTAVRAALKLDLCGRTIQADFGPGEIKTFRIPRDPGKAIVETDFLEWTQ